MSYRYDGFTRIRAALELSDKALLNISDVNNDPAKFPRGGKVRFEFGLFWNDEIIDASAIDAARLRILSNEDPDSTLAIDSITSGAVVTLNTGITQADWDTGEPAKAHLVFEFPASQTAEGVFAGTLADAATKHWFVLTAGASNDFLVAGIIESFDAGLAVSGAAPGVGTTATVEAIEALLRQQLANFVKFKGNPPGATVELTAPTTGKIGKIGLDDEGNLITPNQVTT